MLMKRRVSGQCSTEVMCRFAVPVMRVVFLTPVVKRKWWRLQWKSCQRVQNHFWPPDEHVEEMFRRRGCIMKIVPYFL